MKNKTKKTTETLSLFTNPENTKLNNEDRKIIINKTRFMEILKRLLDIKDLSELKKELLKLKVSLNSTYRDTLGVLNIDTNGDTIEMRKKYLLQEIEQIENTLTIQRAKYYLQRLVKSITEKKTGKINDINLNRWKEYEEIITDSLWIFDKRDTSGAHLAWYWGNFIPQIPRQMMLRYTKQGEWVLDPFVGSGTTLIECRRLGRNGIGIELNHEVAERARDLVNKEPNKHNVITEIITGDSTVLDFKQLLEKKGIKKVQLLIMHPPYHDIIKFSNDPRDLSNCSSVGEFLRRFRKVVENTYDILEKGRYFALVIGDKYSKGEWIPLGFYTMQEVLKIGYKLKSIIVKNFEETRGKRNQKELWRYRALVGGFYVFKHEYIFLFRKI
ncbi:MAG TPA: DNA methyltransferase [Candidatus Desulfofervidus auxilii]|uniref:Methyltransferase n=1 Tax=Desulfofervidus auxilii TaxID=1621989 RepID=A0A7C0YB51_DESA2|nr:DNA methyltransferase [Candidatus Desulfofervidus auxilii]